MIALIQRVSNASVAVDGNTVSSINHGMLILLCVLNGDTEADIDLLIRKITALRIFNDENGVMNISIRDTGGQILVVSQFTLAASLRRGNRPSYIAAAPPEISRPAYETFCSRLRDALGETPSSPLTASNREASPFHARVQTGIFGADMKIALTNDGPVTIILDTRSL